MFGNEGVEAYNLEIFINFKIAQKNHAKAEGEKRILDKLLNDAKKSRKRKFQSERISFRFIAIR